VTAYDDAERLRDEYLLSRTIGDEVANALAVFVCDKRLRAVIEAIDPQAMKQAREALGLLEN